MTKTAQLPKRIFYVWFGDDMPADVHACIQTWKLAMPDYKIIKIGEEKSQWFDFKEALEKCQWLKAVYDRKLWAYVSDYVRIKVLYDHGGLYFDTDVTAQKSFNPIMNNSLFMGFQSEIEVNGAVIGSVQHHPFLKSLLDYYEDGKIFSSHRYLLPEIITHLLKSNYKLEPFDSRKTPKITQLSGITIYPEKTFYPFRYGEKFCDICVTKNTYSVHWWKASWHSEDDINWLQNDRLVYLSKISNKIKEKYVVNTDKINCASPSENILINSPEKKFWYKWFYRVKRRSFGVKYYFFGIPFIVVRKPRHKEYVYLFNTIPLYGK